MARIKYKWKFALFSYLVLVNVFTKSLPIQSKQYSLDTTDSAYKISELPNIVDAPINLEDSGVENEVYLGSSTANNQTRNENSVVNTTEEYNITRNALTRQNIRPGQIINEYSIELTPNRNSFNGRVIIDITLEFATREDPIILHCEDLNIESVMAGLMSSDNAQAANFIVDDGVIEIEPAQLGSTYILIIEYSGSLQTIGEGFFRGQFNDFDYLAMNLHPTNARRVFPCIDDNTMPATPISFLFNNIEYNNLMSNSLLEDNSANQFRALISRPRLWAMAAHNFVNVNLPTTNAMLYIRPNVLNQASQASDAINFYFNTLTEWTEKPYFEIIRDQNDQLNILALPDISTDWYGLSTIGIWEPYVLMRTTCSVKQRYQALENMAKALARQWFGQVRYSVNWRHEWVVSGLASYAAFEVFRQFQEDDSGADVSLLDVNTLFVTDVIQESLYYDAYANAQPLEVAEDIFDEDAIRNYIYGLQKYKAPALLRMMRLILGDETQDFIRAAGRLLLATRALEPMSYQDLVDAINSVWTENSFIENVEEYLEPWIENNGYPLIHVGLRQGGVLVTQERFGFSSPSHISYGVPITYTTSVNPDFTNIEPIEMMDGTMTFNMALDEEEGDFVLFNIQGQGYYRVNYDNDLWNRIIEFLEDPDRRAEIHPLNRATLIDDSLNFARAGRIDYDIAFRVVLSMEHETEYAPWKAFIRNMNFLRRRLEALVFDDEDLDPDIYLRMVRRTIVTFEDEVGFFPDPLVTEPAMTSLTRGLVMQHACKAGYDPCIAAAVDWFYDASSDEPAVNPDIPDDLRPAVYCTMVREGGTDVIDALYDQLEIETSMYERAVILESLACSSDTAFVRNLLEETIAINSPFTTEERVKIFKAAAESSYENAMVTMNFLSMRTNEIRARYGGAARLEEIIFAMAENMADADLANEFNIWTNSQNNNLEESQLSADRANARITQDLDWDDQFMEYVYEWIDENDAPTLVVSMVLISISFMMAFLNH